jgi:tetratricopeptide (TPR) repeat protein
MRLAAAAVRSGRVDEARRIYDDLDDQTRRAGDRILELRVLAARAELDLALGKYARALERLSSLAGSKEEEMDLGGQHWGPTPADMRASALVLLGRTDEALEDLDAGRISPRVFDLRMILAAELRQRGHVAPATACLAELGEHIPGRWARPFLEKGVPAILGQGPVEPLRAFVDTEVQPIHYPLGLFLVGLALWAGGNAAAAMLPWSEAKTSAADTQPAWHWADRFLARAAPGG